VPVEVGLWQEVVLGVAGVAGLVAVPAMALTPAAAAAREELTWEAVVADLFWPVGGSSALG